MTVWESKSQVRRPFRVQCAAACVLFQFIVQRDRNADLARLGKWPLHRQRTAPPIHKSSLPSRRWFISINFRLRLDKQTLNFLLVIWVIRKFCADIFLGISAYSKSCTNVITLNNFAIFHKISSNQTRLEPNEFVVTFKHKPILQETHLQLTCKWLGYLSLCD